MWRCCDPYDNVSFKEAEEELVRREANKENKVPEINDEEQEEFEGEEPEIMDYYEDSSRRMRYLNEPQEENVETYEITKEIQPAVVPLPRLPPPAPVKEWKPEPKLLYPLPPLPPIMMNIEENEEDYQKVSVKELITTFENVQHKEKVHVNRVIKESSSESEQSEGKPMLPWCLLCLSYC